MKRKKVTIVRTRMEVPGFHNWENCPIEAVSFLKERHRHIFEITVGVVVTHDDRDVEFFVLQRDVRGAIRSSFRRNRYDEYEFGSSSCEMIAERIIERLEKVSFKRDACGEYELDEALTTAEGYTIDSVIVSEDGESEAEVRLLAL